MPCNPFNVDGAFQIRRVSDTMLASESGAFSNAERITGAFVSRPDWLPEGTPASVRRSYALGRRSATASLKSGPVTPMGGGEQQWH